MANGTAGLGQGTQVFDFSNVGQAGLAYDARQYAKKSEFAKQNASLYDGVDASGIRDVDSPYINAELEKAMELSATAQKSLDPADAQRAKNAMAQVSQMAATSKAALTKETADFSVLRGSDEYVRNKSAFDTHLDEHRNSTAMTAANGGQVGQGIMYQAPVMYDMEKSVAQFAGADAEKVLRGSLEQMGMSVENADGTGFSKSLSEVDPEIKADLIAKTYGSQMESNKEFRLAVEAQYMGDYFGKEDLLDSDVEQFNALRSLGNELRSEFADVAAIENAPQFKNNPFARRRAIDAFELENNLDAYGKRVYTEAVDPRATKGTASKKSVDNNPTAKAADGGKSILDDLALNNGRDVQSVLGNVKITKGGTALNTPNQKLGYASAPKMKAYSSGSGEERIVVGGVVAQNVGGEMKYFAVEYKPSEDIMTKVKALEASGASEAAISQLLQKTDATLVPITGGYSRIPSGDLRVMKAASEKQAGMVNIGEENAPEAESAEGVGSKYN